MIKKVGILLIILIVPTFIYLGLKFKGTNHYKLPRFVPAIDSTTGELLMKKTEHPKWGEPEQDTVFQTIPLFKLIDQNGKEFNSATLQNKIFVASFFFTRCTTICPKISFQLARVRDAFIGQDEIRFISISVDPVYDTPEQLKIYAKRFEADPKQWNFLTGKKSYIYPLVLKGFHVPLADASEYDAAIKNPDESFIHSERLILVDKEGIIRGFYDGTDAKEVDRLILELNVLKSIYTNQ